ncbi:MAG: transposase [Flavobacteriales bacterium Tduv]
MIFCDFRLEDQIPDHTTLCKFRNEIVAKKAYDRLLKNINKELEKYQVILQNRSDSRFQYHSDLPCSQGSSYLRSRGSEGKIGKANQSKKR